MNYLIPSLVAFSLAAIQSSSAAASQGIQNFFADAPTNVLSVAIFDINHGKPDVNLQSRAKISIVGGDTVKIVAGKRSVLVALADIVAVDYQDQSSLSIFVSAPGPAP